VFHIPSAVRRPLAVVGAAVAGLAAAVALGSPASAHHSDVVGTAECDTTTGEYVVDWTVTSVAPPSADHYRFYDVVARAWVGDQASDVTIPAIAVTDDFVHASDEKLRSGELRYPGDTTRLRLKVRAEWNNGYQETRWRGATLTLSGDCAADQPNPHAEAVSDCQNLVVTLSNEADARKAATFVVKGEAFTREVTIAKDGEPVPVTIPKDKAGTVTVTEKGTDWSAEFAWKDPGDCGLPEGTFEATCDSLTFRAENPADGREVKVTFTPSVGEPVARTLAPGTGMEPVVFPGSAGLTVTVSSPGEDDVVVDYDKEKPANCDQDTPTLPKTGADAGTLAGGASGLLVVGGALFYVARRRRLRFTA
jgi:LPXTG-motif cell wall-anchored protein